MKMNDIEARGFGRERENTSEITGKMALGGGYLKTRA